MNCEAYIAYFWNGQISLFPNNMEPSLLTSIFAALPADDGEIPCDILAIRRQDDMLYYAFIVPLDNTAQDRLCFMVGLNNILVTDILALVTFMRHTMRELAESCRIARFDATRGIYTRFANEVAKLSEAQAVLRDRFNERFDGYGTKPGPRDYANRPVDDLYTLNPNGSTRRDSASIGQNSSSLSESIKAGNTVLIKSRNERIQGSDDSNSNTDNAPDTTTEGDAPVKRKKGSSTILVWCLIPIFVMIVIYIYNLRNSTTLYDDSEIAYMNDATVTEAEMPSEIQEITPETDETTNDQDIQFYKGYFSYNGDDYPVMIAFKRTGTTTNAVYKNVAYGGTIKMDYMSYDDKIILSGNDGSNKFTINLEWDGKRFTGTTTDGNKTMLVTLMPTNETFESKYLN